VGSSLRRQLREVLPASIKGLQRAVALEIADDARYDDAGRYDPEKGRHSRVRLADLVRWTGAKDELSVREMLRRLAVAGWEFRVPIGIGKDGRPLFAVPGKAMQFRVPDFEAPTTVGPYETEGPTMVGASEGEGPTVVGEGPTTVAEGPTVVAEGPTTVGPPSQVPPPTSHRDPTTTSPAEPVETEPPAASVNVTDGGGGGDPDLRSLAIRIAGALDYRGKPPTKTQRKVIEDRLLVWLEAGWSMDGLAVVLDITGQDVRYAPALYAMRLDPAEMPAPAPDPAPAATRGGNFGDLPAVGPSTRRDTADGGLWERAEARARQRMAATGAAGGSGGTDDIVAGWMDLASSPALAAAQGAHDGDLWATPAVPDAPAWCGELECDPVTRTRDVEMPGGLKASARCHKCHPKAGR
jgi:hypothetical protein